MSELERDRSVFVVIDACYSGNAVRSLFRSLAPVARTQSRHVNLATLAASTRGVVNKANSSSFAADPDLCFRCGTRVAEPYPYRNVFYLAAASENEPALDLPRTNYQGKPQGAFSDALLQVLAGRKPADSNNDGNLSYGELHRAVYQIMRGANYPHTPQMLPKQHEDPNNLINKSVFERSNRLPGSGQQTPAAITLRVRCGRWAWVGNMHNYHNR